MTPPRPTTAIILAAGVGRRLGDFHDAPKVLLPFDGRTLLARHLDALTKHGILRVLITVGYKRDAIIAEVARLGVSDRVSFVTNERFREGSLVSLHAQSVALRGGEPILLMDGDVLYDPRMIATLVEEPGENILLLDRDIEPGEEPVKICLRGDRIVDFRKKPDDAGDRHGESVGFFRFSAATAAALADRCATYVAAGNTTVEYEEAIRDLILAEPHRFRAVDVTHLPWVEIDFEPDVLRALDEVLPLIDRRRAA
ncbi:NTP transferase domain-containing protein [Roseomonas sp. CCTCC AB2023176]|uniref:phosphocholine cytidylyltransferase family protein n=1 Tax=Roseomonas sp. CCTCC AB2023176 TaxID=3342640 RepID=UPI0035DF6BB1